MVTQRRARRNMESSENIASLLNDIDDHEEERVDKDDQSRFTQRRSKRIQEIIESNESPMESSTDTTKSKTDKNEKDPDYVPHSSKKLSPKKLKKNEKDNKDRTVARKRKNDGMDSDQDSVESIASNVIFCGKLSIRCNNAGNVVFKNAVLAAVILDFKFENEESGYDRNVSIAEITDMLESYD